MRFPTRNARTTARGGDRSYAKTLASLQPQVKTSSGVAFFFLYQTTPFSKSSTLATFAPVFTSNARTATLDAALLTGRVRSHAKNLASLQPQVKTSSGVV
eukprot:5841585-Prymnesium_polylepis.1